MSTEAKAFFTRIFGYPPTLLAQAPGRLELLGNHTDYNGGLVLSLAVDKYIWLAAAPRRDGQIELASSSFEGVEKFRSGDFTRSAANPWSDYVKGVLSQLAQRGAHIGGFHAIIHGTVPTGAGLSSSAALEVATALAVRKMYPYALSETGLRPPPARTPQGEVSPLPPTEKMALAKLCQAAENKFVGVQSGLLDQISALFGRAGHAIQIDFLNLGVEHLVLPQVAVVVCHSGVKHELVGGEYNERRQLCEAAARKLGVQWLRLVEPKTLAEKRALLSEREYQCAYHVVGENQRVLFAERALRSGDLHQFGQYLFQSHESSRDFFQNSTPELDTLVELARAHPACWGARLTGGGFGGATLNLVKPEAIEEFKMTIARQYAEKTGHRIEPLTCRVVDGAA